MSKKILYPLILLALLVLMGCATNSNIVSDKMMQYKENSTIYSQEGVAYQRHDIGIANNYVFYYILSDTDDGQLLSEVYAQNIDSNDAPKKIWYSRDDEIICASDAFIENEKEFYALLIASEEGEITRVNFDNAGNEIERILTNGEIGDFKNIVDMAVINNMAYAVSETALYVIDGYGKATELKKCPGNRYRKVISCGDDAICTTYEKGADSYAQVMYLDGASKEKNYKISGDGSLITYDNKLGIIYSDGKGLNVIESDASRLLFSYEGRNIRPDQIKVIKTDGDNILLWGNSSDGASTKLITLSLTDDFESPDKKEKEKEKLDRFGRRVIYLYSFIQPLDDRLSDIIDSFNERANDCQIVVMSHSDNESMYGNDIAKMISDGTFPDVLFSYYTPTIYKFAEDGLLENLLPYIEKSSTVSVSDFDENVLDGYTVNSELIGLPAYIMFDSLWTVDWLEAKTEIGWSYEDFFAWYKAAANPAGPLNSKEHLFEKIFTPLLNECIDATGTAHFDNEKFIYLLTSIKDLGISTKALGKKESFDIINEWNNDDKKCWLGTSIISYDNLYGIGYSHGKEANIVGYPSYDGNLIVYYDMPALSISAISEVKDDAYSFVQYYLTYIASENSPNIMNQNYIYTYKKNRQNSINASLELVKDNSTETQIMEKSIEAAELLLENARQKDYRTDYIVEIVKEESMSYFSGEKDIDETCKIINSRVQIYLDEAK